MKPDDPRKIMKGWSVFLGDQVKDRDGKWSILAEFGSTPPTKEAARALDALQQHRWL
jgi:hypothetical protein